jgi:hypothetical protein
VHMMGSIFPSRRNWGTMELFPATERRVESISMTELGRVLLHPGARSWLPMSSAHHTQVWLTMNLEIWHQVLYTRPFLHPMQAEHAILKKRLTTMRKWINCMKMTPGNLKKGTVSTKGKQPINKSALQTLVS